MARITEKDLEDKVQSLNMIFGFKRTYIKSKAEYRGKSFDLDYAYGGVKLIKYGKTGSGIREVSPRLTKSELADFIDAFCEGIYQYKTRKK